VLLSSSKLAVFSKGSASEVSLEDWAVAEEATGVEEVESLLLEEAARGSVQEGGGGGAQQ
jgi:hypothetical protein